MGVMKTLKKRENRKKCLDKNKKKGIKWNGRVGKGGI